MTKQCPTCGAEPENTANFCRLDGSRLTIERPAEIGATVGYETLGAESPDRTQATPARPTTPALAEPTMPYPLRHLTSAVDTPTSDPKRPVSARAVALGVAIVLVVAAAPAGAYFSFRTARADQAAAQVSDVVPEASDTEVTPEEVVPAPASDPIPAAPEVPAPSVEPIPAPTPVQNARAARPAPRPSVRRVSARPKRASSTKPSGSKSDDRREKKESAEDDEEYGGR